MILKKPPCMESVPGRRAPAPPSTAHSPAGVNAVVEHPWAFRTLQHGGPEVGGSLKAALHAWWPPLLRVWRARLCGSTAACCVREPHAPAAGMHATVDRRPSTRGG